METKGIIKKSKPILGFRKKNRELKVAFERIEKPYQHSPFLCHE